MLKYLIMIIYSDLQENACLQLVLRFVVEKMARASNNNNIIGIEENEENIREQFEFLLGIFPDADPRFLREMCDAQCNCKNNDRLQKKIRKSLKFKDYPRKQDYEKKQERISQVKFYNENFNIENFLKIIPNPEEHFSEKNKKRMNMIKYMNSEEKIYSEIFIRNLFPLIYCNNIKTALVTNNYDLIKTVDSLKKSTVYMKKRRNQYDLSLYYPKSISIELIQEIAYIKNRKDIFNYIQTKEIKRKNDIAKAKASNSLNTCGCCYDDEILSEESMRCENGHIFCLQCTKKGCEIMLEQGKQEFPCLTNCDKYFNVFDLENLLSPKVFSSVCQAKQLKEIKAAQVENLECCPHCDFAAIVDPQFRVFQCFNPECRKETCRLCREPAHCPLRCEEVEKSEDVKMRKFFEDKMTDALVRTCYKCNTKFLKEEGCNRMRCTCGAMMCYVCRQPVQDYSHFNGAGGDKYHLCPLFSNTEKLHAKNVLEEAKKLRKSIANLKIDPIENIETYYKSKKKNRCHCGNCKK